MQPLKATPRCILGYEHFDFDSCGSRAANNALQCVARDRNSKSSSPCWTITICVSALSIYARGATRRKQFAASRLPCTASACWLPTGSQQDPAAGSFRSDLRICSPGTGDGEALAPDDNQEHP